MFSGKITTIVVALVLSVAATRASGDVIHLRSGKDVEGRVAAYAGLVFDVATDDGKTAKHQAALISRIDFSSDPPVTVSADIRNRGTLTGTLSSFENSNFTIQFGKESPEKIAMLLITRMTFVAPPPKPIEPITRGDEVDIASHIVQGKVTLVEFYGDFPAAVACKIVSQYLQVLSRDDVDLVVVKIDIGEFESPVATQYGITAVPRVDVYNRAGKLVGTMEGNRQPQLIDLIKKAKAAH